MTDQDLHNEEQLHLLKAQLKILKEARVNFIERGDYKKDSLYKVLDIVKFGQSYFICLEETRDNPRTNKWCEVHKYLKPEQGKQGIQGLSGRDGADGIDGKDGLTGKQGIQGPKGDKGDKGDTGKAGKDGAKGAKGDKGDDGKSAFEIWKAKGNKGSETDFLSSLRGQNGSPGAGSRVPNGGTTGQVLKKASNANQDLVWGTGGGGGSGTVETIVAGTNIDVDATDPANPIVSVESLTVADISDITASTTEINYTDGVTSAIQTQLNAKLDDSQISDTAYDATTWNANLDAPTKNAIRDKIESMVIPTTLDQLSDVIDYSAPGDGEVLTWVDANNQWENVAPAGGAGDMVLADAQSVTGLKTFDTTKIAVKGSSTGTTAIASANAGATNYTATLQAVTGTIALTSDITGTNSGTNTGDQDLSGKQDAGATLTSLEGLSLVAGDILYATAADTLTRLAKGTALQQLRINAGATAPEWATSSAGQTLVTHIVAASGGTHTTLGAAVAAAANGDTIYIREGTYVESAITSALTDITIIGENAESAILSLGTTTCNFSGTGVQIINCGITSSTGKLTLGGARAKLTNCKRTVTGSPGATSAILMSGVDAVIENLYFETTSATSTATSAIIMSGERAKISNSNLLLNLVNASAVGVGFQDTGSIITGCTFKPITSGEGGGKAISMSQQGVANNNNFRGYTSSQTGAFINGDSYAVVSGNEFAGGKLGVLITTNSSVTGNVFKGTNGNSGICVSVTGDHNSVTGNTMDLNAGSVTGVTIAANCDRNVVSSNMMLALTTGVSIGSAANDNVVSGNVIYAATTGITITSTATNSTITGNDLVGCTTYITNSGTASVLNANYPVPITLQRSIANMKNTSGVTINAGEVVVWKAVANGDEVTTTTTASDPLVMGVSEASIGNNSYGHILTAGKTVLLKVDGTTDIAVGDFLTTYTTAGIARKASAGTLGTTPGDLAFAIALEAYTADDSSGVIDALLISPRRL